MSCRSPSEAMDVRVERGAGADPLSTSVHPRCDPSPELACDSLLLMGRSASLLPVLENDSGRPKPFDLGDLGSPRGVWLPYSGLARPTGEGLDVDAGKVGWRNLIPASCAFGVVLRKVVRTAGGGLSGPVCPPSWLDRRREPPIGIREPSPSLAL